MKQNYIDGKGVYHNELNLTLAQIYDSGVEFGCKVTAKDKAEDIIAELEKIKEEIGNEFVDLQDGSEEWRSYVNDAVLSCYEIVDKHIMDLKEEPFGEITNSKGVLEQIAEEQKTLLDTTKAWSKALEHGDIY